MRGRGRWWLIGTSAAVAAVATAVLTVAGSLALLHASGDLQLFRLGAGREHLDPIAVPKTACPSVEAIHSAANDFQLVYTSAVFGFDANQHEASWPELRPELDRSALALTAAVESGIPSFPRPIRRRLTRVLAALVEGRARLGAVTEAAQLDDQTDGLFRLGQEQFGFAGDLVGGRCRVALGADDDSRFLARLAAIPPSTTTTAPPAPPVPSTV